MERFIAEPGFGAHLNGQASGRDEILDEGY